MILTDHMCLRVIIFWMSLSMLVDVAEPLVGMMLAPMCADGKSWGKTRSKCIGPDAPHVHKAPSLSRSPGRCCGQTQQRSDFSLNQLEIDNTSDSTRIDGGIFTAWWPFDVLIHMLGQSCISLVSCMVGATKDQLLNALIKAMAGQEAIG